MRGRFQLKIGKCTADCIIVGKRAYANGVFSSGLVRGLPHGDNYYLRIEKDGMFMESEGPFTLFLRKDEMAALIELAALALWTNDILERSKK